MAAGAHGAITAERRRNGPGHPVHRGRPKRVQLYRELISTMQATLAYLHRATTRLATATDPAASSGRPRSNTIGP